VTRPGLTAGAAGLTVLGPTVCAVSLSKMFFLQIFFYFAHVSIIGFAQKIWVTVMSARRHTAPPVAQMRGDMLLL
jgi:hypothetical protein